VDVLKIAEYVDVILDSRKEYNAYQFFWDWNVDIDIFRSLKIEWH
jgi:hypothetical protein